MRKFFWGLVLGWFLTNLFSIPLPPAWFWWLVIAIIVALLFIGWISYLLNHDDYPEFDIDTDTETYEEVDNVH